MAYSAITKAADYFNTLLYSGNSSVRSLTGVGFEPSWVWIKERTSTSDHMLFDQPRGVEKYMSSNQDTIEQTSSSMLTAFDSDGFSLGSGNDVNDNGQTYVSWNWKGNGAGSSNTDGSINTTTTSANTTSGVSISTYTGTGSAATVGHGLGVVPEMLIVKQRTGTQWWFVYHIGMGNDRQASLNTTGAESGGSSAYWNSTTPTSSVFSVGTDGATNGSGEDLVAYAFAPVKGFSKFGKYTGNGSSNGTFVYTGFSPAFVMVKRIDNTGHWIMKDNKRPGYNPNHYYIWSDAADVETSASSVGMDLFSNGFKLTGNAGNTNASGGSFIYMAFAQSPLVANVDGGLPATAR